jgi:hypothetical protein
MALVRLCLSTFIFDPLDVSGLALLLCKLKLRPDVDANTTARSLKQVRNELSLEVALQDNVSLLRIHGIDRENL